MTPDRITVLIVAVMMLPIMVFGLKTCAEGCPPGKTMVRGVWAWECVAR